jgi:hypothetical protein
MKQYKGFFINVFLCLSLSVGCNGQTECNRKVVDRSLIKYLSKSICIPKGSAIYNIIVKEDLNMDGKNDIIIKYMNAIPSIGDIVYYDAYFYKNDSLHLLSHTFTNLEPLYVKNYDPQSENALANKIIDEYPKNVEVEFKDSQIIISHHLYDVYGKSYFFSYNKKRNDWILVNMKYWIGDLSSNYISLMGLSNALLNKVVIEENEPSQELFIKDFDLKKSKEKAEEEGERLMNEYDLLNWRVKN